MEVKKSFIHLKKRKKKLCILKVCCEKIVYLNAKLSAEVLVCSMGCNIIKYAMVSATLYFPIYLLCERLGEKKISLDYFFFKTNM